MKTLEEIYTIMCSTPSDINQHIPTLKAYAEKCDTITELGVRAPTSLWGFVAGKPKIINAYAIEHPGHFKPDEIENISIRDVERICKEENIEFNLHIKDVLATNIEQTDLLFIDTEHNYYQMRQELALHSEKVTKYIAFHDVVTWGVRGEIYGRPNLFVPGIMVAIEEFLFMNRNWRPDSISYENNGLLVIRREGV